MFANDIDGLMREFLDGDAHGIHMEFDQPATEDADVAASWTVVGLPAHFNDATSNLNSGLLGVMCKAMGEDGARTAFLESLFNDALDV